MAVQARLFSLGSVFFACCIPAFAQELADASLSDDQVRRLPNIARRAIEAHPNLRYAGKRFVEIVVGGKRVGKEEIVVYDKGQQRIEYPGDSSEAGRVIVSKGNERYTYSKKQKEVLKSAQRVEGGLRSLLARRINNRFRFETSPGVSIAGRQTTLFSVVNPRGIKLFNAWIDPDSGMILRQEIYGPNGGYVGGFQFSEIDFSPRITGETFKTEFGDRPIVTAQQILLRQARKLNMQALLLRDNRFHLESSRVLRRPDGDVLSSVYVGGASKVSVMQVRGELDPAKFRQIVSGYNVVVNRFGDLSVAVVGSLPEDVLRQIAGNLGPAP